MKLNEKNKLFSHLIIIIVYHIFACQMNTSTRKSNQKESLASAYLRIKKNYANASSKKASGEKHTSTSSRSHLPSPPRSPSSTQLPRSRRPCRRPDESISSPPPSPDIPIISENNHHRKFTKRSINHHPQDDTHHTSIDTWQDSTVAVALETKFIQQIKVTGLRPIRENMLIKSFQTVIANYKQHIDALSCSTQDWVAYAQDLKESSSNIVNDLELEILEEVEKRTQMKDRIFELEEMHRPFLLERDQMHNQLKEAKEEKKQIIHSHRIEMDSFLDQMEKRVDRIRQNTFSKQEMDHMKNQVQAEYNDNFRGSMVQIEHLQREREQNQEAQEAEARRLDLASNQFKEELKLKQSEVDQLKETKEITEKQVDELRSLMSSMVLRADMDKHRLELSNAEDKNRLLKTNRERELNAIEERVKLVMDIKDCKLKEAEERANAFECCIKKLEAGLV